MNDYTYIDGTHKVKNVINQNTGDEDAFDYDYNGNVTSQSSTNSNNQKLMFWDEQDRMKAFYNWDAGVFQYYTYDDAGERTIKYTLEDGAALYQNGELMDQSFNMRDYKLYPNPYLVVTSDGRYTKHYFDGSTRIASRIATGTDIFQQRPAGQPKNRESKVVDPAKDLKIYLEKAGLGDIKISTEFAKAPAPTADLYYLHGDHLGTATFVTDGNGETTQFFLNLPFGETMAEQNLPGAYENPYKFNAKELDRETNLYYYGARYYNPRLSIWYGVDPLAEKMPSWSPYVYTFNNPINLIDPDGREPVPSYYRLNPWFRLKSTQWYSTLGVYDSKTFHAAASYSTQHLRHDAFQSVYQRNAYYGWAQSQADAKGFGSKWFGAASLVTQLNAVGATELVNLGVIKDNTEAFLKNGNKFLFSHNMKNAKDLLADGKLSGGFTDANGKSQSFNGLTGTALDNKMVEFEQSKVQQYINSYKGNDINSIMGNINDLFTGNVAKAIGPGAVNEVMKESFNGGKSFNFKNYSDRVKLGQELIKKAH